MTSTLISAALCRRGDRRRAAHAAGDERRGVALMVAGGLLLGTLGLFVEEAGQHPLTTVWFRCAFGLLALLVWGALGGRLAELRLRGAALGAALAAGVLMIANWALFFAAITRTSIGVATVVFHVQPLWVLILLGAWWLREPVSRRQAGAVLLALAGLTLASGLFDGAALGRTQSPGYVAGLLMCLAGSLSYAGVTLIAKLARTRARSRWRGGSVPSARRHSLPGRWCTAGRRGVAAWAWLAGLGVIHTGLAYGVLYAGMARLSTSRIALLQFVYPAAAVLLDWRIYGRTLSALQGAGMTLMAGALWTVRRSD